jgi:hypothetical protein
MTIEQLADHLTAQGIEVVRVLQQTTQRPGVYPDEVVAVGLELGNDLSVYVLKDGTVELYCWEDEELVDIGEFNTTHVDGLLKAIKEQMPNEG